MADVVKWLRPRIVVPICVGSNPTIRPIFKLIGSTEPFFIFAPFILHVLIKFWTMSLLNTSTNIGKSFYLRDFNSITVLIIRIGSINANYK